MTNVAATPDTQSQGAAKSRYEQMTPVRDSYLRRARKASKLTIPSIVPPDGHSHSTELPTPFQGLGARGVNNLASKLVLTVQPPNSPSFRLGIAPKHADQLETDAEFKAEVDKALSTYERTVQQDIEASGDRIAAHEAFKHLLVAGNVLMFVAPEGTRLFHLDRYVVRRDGMGRPLEIVVKESFDHASLPENVQPLVAGTTPGVAGPTTEKTVDVYTHIMRKAKQWFIYQEVQGQRVPDSEGQYPLDKTPWLPLRLVRVDGEDYGRGYVEEYLGDLQSLEALSKAIVEGSAAAAKVLFLVKPHGTTSKKTVAEAPNGAIRDGNADDVSTIQLDKFADFRTARETMSRIEDRLAFAFLLNSAVQRQGERVTAEEIRYMAQELEDALGGIYSVLAMDYQLPYINRKIISLQKVGALPRLPKGVVRVQITTGLEALGRGHDRNKLVGYVDDLNKLGPDVLKQEVHTDVLAKRLAISAGIDTEGLLKTPDEKAAEQRQNQTAAITDKVAPELVKQVGGAVMSQQQQQQPPEG